MKIEYHITNNTAIVERCLGEEQRIEIPEQIDGSPVSEVQAYAFSYSAGSDGQQAVCGEQLKEIILPKTLRRIGNYAFYGCRKLEKMTISHQTEDIAGGAFTGCHALKTLDIRMDDAFGYCLKDILSELHQELRVNLLFESGESAQLLYPEYYEESVENTPARILETHFLGSGYHYRQAFRDGKINFREYDRLFSEATAWESEDFCIELAFLRLQQPYRLNEEAQGMYISWLMEHRMSAAAWCIVFEQTERMEYLSMLVDWTKEEIMTLIEEANRRNRVEIQSFLLDYQHEHFRPKKKTFDF